MVGYNKAPLRRLLSQATQKSGVEPELQGNMIFTSWTNDCIPPLHCLPKTHMSSFFTQSHSTWHSSLRPIYLSLFYSVIVFVCSFNIVNLRSPVLVIFDVGRVSALIKLESSLDTFGLFHRHCSHGPNTVDKQWAMPDLGRHCYL